MPKTSATAPRVHQGAAIPPELISDNELPVWRQMLHESPSWLSSLLLHASLILLLAWTAIPQEPVPGRPELQFSKASPTPGEDELEELLEPEQPPAESPEIADLTKIQSPLSDAISVDEAMTLQAVTIPLDVLDNGTMFGAETPLSDGNAIGNALRGRNAAARSAALRRYTKTAGTQTAVDLALEWIAAHQNANGSWSFDHRKGVCQSRCKNQGSFAEAYNGATALALLPFLGAGQTHMQGDYQDVVKRGLYYLTRSMNVSKRGGSLWEPGGTMYSHGLASIALCEAYGMTQDPALSSPAQQALDYIMYAQDPVGGGWRYGVRQPGDTSVVGWQVMALKSGHMAYLRVNASNVRGAIRFLDNVQSDAGSAYGYTRPGQGEATTAVGLLCRMYLGWKLDNQALARGVSQLAQLGPQPDDYYYNYYATQVLFHYTGGVGPVWEEWDAELSSRLVRTQARQGHARGSWYFDSSHASRGGRLYCTAMATMILEVYYRHMPIYRSDATTDEFPE